MLVIGLTGGIGSGKSTVAELFQEQGIEIIDADLISRELVEPGQPALSAIVEHFGDNIIDQHGLLKRSVLRELVFNDKNERDWLEQLLHPLIAERLQYLITHCKTAYCILMSPLLMETGQKDMVDRILVIDVSRETQIERTVKRDISSRETIEAIVESQIDRDKRLELADDVLNNDKEIELLTDEVKNLHQFYLGIATGF
jgi:dephospho-CoA kinase